MAHREDEEETNQEKSPRGQVVHEGQGGIGRGVVAVILQTDIDDSSDEGDTQADEVRQPGTSLL